MLTLDRDSIEYSPSCFHVGENHLPSYPVQRTPMLPEEARSERVINSGEYLNQALLPTSGTEGA